MAKVTITAVGGAKYQMEGSVRTHTIVSDVGTNIKGGNDKGPDPMEFWLMGIGFCTLMTIKGYKDKKGWDIQELSVVVSTTEETATDPDDSSKQITITVIHEDIEVKGNLTQAELDDILATAATCKVAKLTKTPNKRIDATITKKV